MSLLGDTNGWNENTKMIENHDWLGRLAPGEDVQARTLRGRIPVGQRLAAKIELDPETGCLNRTGTLSHNGYGQIGVYYPEGKRLVRTHRLAYEMANGLIPDGMQVDHLCRNRRCCNPSHLEVVTPKENTLRGNSPSALNAQVAHCRLGHPYNALNTQLIRGRRHCWVCRMTNRPARFRQRATLAKLEAVLASFEAADNPKNPIFS